MKKGLISMAVACSALLMLAACATKQEAAETTETAKRVLTMLGDKHFKVDIESMTPRRGGGRPVSYGFSLEVKGDTLVSYLPYFGRAYTVPYGGGKGLNFTQKIASYETTRPKQDLTRIVMRVTNEEDTYLFNVDIFDNGRAYITVRPRERDQISYTGSLQNEDIH